MTRRQLDHYSVFAGYRIDVLLGRGPRSVVYRAHHLGLRRDVALKLVGGPARIRQEIVRRSRTVVGLDLPNTVPVYEAGESEASAFIAMRLIEGTDLQTEMERGRLDPRWVAHAIRRIAGALDAAHAAGIVHGRVKPSNILIDRNRHAYLSDFGMEPDPGPALEDIASLAAIADELLPQDAPRRRYESARELSEDVGSRVADEVPPPRALRPMAALRRVAVGAVVALVAGLLLWRVSDIPFADGGPVELDPAPGSVSLLDPASRRLEATVPIGGNPTHVIVGRGMVWVGALEAATVWGIDPAGGELRIEIPLHGRAAGMAGGFRSLWVLNGVDGIVSRFEAATGNHVADVSVGVGATDLGIGPSGVWVVNEIEGSLARIDPRTHELGGEIELGATPGEVLVTENAIWVANTVDGSVTRVDPATERVEAAIPLGIAPTALAYRDGILWVANGLNDVVTKIDAARGAILTTIAVGDLPADLVAGDTAVWVANRRSGTISEIDPDRDEVVRTYELEGSPADLAAGAGGLWFTVQGISR